MSDFKVQGKLGLDGSGFFSTLGKAHGMVNSFGGMLAGAFSVGAITAFSKSILDLAGNLNDVSEALALNVEFLQRFVNSARQSGGGLGDVEKFLFKANESRQAAVNKPGGPEATAFRALGFSSDQVANATAQQFMEQIIRAFADGATTQEMNALGDIGGKSAKKLVGGFKDGLDQATEIMTQDLVVQLDEIGDKFTSLATTLKVVFAPALMFVADAVLASVNKIKQAGSLVGGASVKPLSAKDILTILFQGLPAFAVKRLFSDDAQTAAANEIIAQQKQEEADKKTLDAKKAERESNQNASPGLTAEAEKEKAVKSSNGVGGFNGDSLLAVGNFLGAGKANSLQSIAEKHLTVATQQLDVLKKLAGNMNSLTIPI